MYKGYWTTWERYNVQKEASSIVILFYNKVVGLPQVLNEVSVEMN